MQEDAKKMAELLKVLANENRLMIFCALMEKPLTVSELCERIPNVTISGLSQHLSLLKAHHILSNHKDGLHVTYTIQDDRVKEVIKVLKQYYCSK